MVIFCGRLVKSFDVFRYGKTLWSLRLNVTICFHKQRFMKFNTLRATTMIRLDLIRYLNQFSGIQFFSSHLERICLNVNRVFILRYFNIFNQPFARKLTIIKET